MAGLVPEPTENSKSRVADGGMRWGWRGGRKRDPRDLRFVKNRIRSFESENLFNGGDGLMRVRWNRSRSSEHAETLITQPRFHQHQKRWLSVKKVLQKAHYVSSESLIKKPGNSDIDCVRQLHQTQVYRVRVTLQGRDSRPWYGINGDLGATDRVLNLYRSRVFHKNLLAYLHRLVLLI